jgi:predicted negative regulator of RcsB-dependent stress response
MAFDLEEQEQLDALKAFWSSKGKWIAAALLAAAAGYLGYVGWAHYQKGQAEQAVEVYGSVDTALQKGDLAALKGVQSKLAAEYPNSAYAVRAALLGAKLAFDKGDVAYTESQLKWVLANSKDADLKSVARLRLAAVLLDQKKFDAAISELGQEHPVAFDALFLDMKGDVASAKGDTKQARDAYRAALAKLVGESPNRQFIQTKLDALGG